MTDTLTNPFLSVFLIVNNCAIQFLKPDGKCLHILGVASTLYRDVSDASDRDQFHCHVTDIIGTEFPESATI